MTNKPDLARTSDLLSDDLMYHLLYTLGRDPDSATPSDVLEALALALRRPMVDAMRQTEARQRTERSKRIAYLSMEFLMGRALENNLLNLGLLAAAQKAVARFGIEFSSVAAAERDAALGNGGLGRLAACFLDSLATLDYSAVGYGINYEFGLFRQEIANGEQREHPDQWFNGRSPWVIERADRAVMVPVYGHIEHSSDKRGGYNPMWLGWRLIVGVPHDFPIVGHGGRTVNVLRLYSARASDDFDMRIFNTGDYFAAVEEKMRAETVSKVLYPSDEVPSGRELRLLQEYFLVACAIRDLRRNLKAEGIPATELPSRVAIQLNDTHPSLTVAELMRVLVDEDDLGWDESFEITKQTLAYTNHTLLSEALEKWPVALLERVLPRHLQIIFEINRRFLEDVARRWPGDTARLARMSLIGEGDEKQVRMAHLSIVGSHSVNGVAKLHSDLVKTQLVPDFHDMWPERFNNKTNGVTQRRWLLHANPELARLISRELGSEWIVDLERLRGLESRATDLSFCEEFEQVKRANKTRLAARIQELVGVRVDPNSLFDVQVKRIHEYKRQLLNIMHVIHLYLSIVDDQATLPGPRTCVFSGKAAPGYFMAKKIIHLINVVANTVNDDPRVREQLKVVFLPDFRVSLAECIIPAADLSEQISTAGTEASGTGNMKLSLNGALTLGTLDGANIEIRDEVGADNIFIFGLTEPEAVALRPHYEPRAVCRADADLSRVVQAIGDGRFCPESPSTFECIVHQLLGEDRYLHLADFRSYVAAQTRVAEQYLDRQAWLRKSILNTARMGKFSSDRTIREYADEIWSLEPRSGSRQAVTSSDLDSAAAAARSSFAANDAVSIRVG